MFVILISINQIISWTNHVQGSMQMIELKLHFLTKHLVKCEDPPWEGLVTSSLVLPGVAGEFGCWHAVCTQGWQNFCIGGGGVWGVILGSKLSSVLEQSILRLSKRIFRSISIKILWIDPLCWFRVKCGRGVRGPPLPCQLHGLSPGWLSRPQRPNLLRSWSLVPKGKPGEKQVSNGSCTCTRLS